MANTGSGIRQHDLRDALTRRLQNRYEISPQEAASAVADFVGSRTPPISVLADESLLEGAAFAAYSLWTGVTDPRVVAVQEELERVTGLEEGIKAAETSWDLGGPGEPKALLRSYRDLEAARTTLTELVAAHPHPLPEWNRLCITLRTWAARPRPWQNSPPPSTRVSHVAVGTRSGRRGKPLQTWRQRSRRSLCCGRIGTGADTPPRTPRQLGHCGLCWTVPGCGTRSVLW